MSKCNLFVHKIQWKVIIIANVFHMLLNVLTSSFDFSMMSKYSVPLNVVLFYFMNDATMPSKAAQRHVVTGAVHPKVLNTDKTFVIIYERFDIINMEQISC